jgi:hypothetical protein
MNVMAVCTRVVIQNTPAMLRDIVQNVLATQPDIVLLQALPPAVPLSRWRQSEPDVVVAFTHDINDGTSIADCLNRWPRARILMIEITGREVVLHELRPHATPLGALSPEQLVSVIREGTDDGEDGHGPAARDPQSFR